MISNKVLIILLLFLIVLGGVSLVTIRSEGSKCMADPVRYSLEIMEAQAQDNVTCSCSGGSFSMVFNKEGSIPIEKSYDTFEPVIINFSMNIK